MLRSLGLVGLVDLVAGHRAPPNTPDAPPIPDLLAQPRGGDGGELGVGGGDDTGAPFSSVNLGFSNSPTWMELLMHGLQPGAIHTSVDLRRRNIDVSQ
jgi:hypothetical protein